MRVLVTHSGNLYGGLERVLETFVQAPRYGAAFEPRVALCFEGPIATSLRGLGLEPMLIGDVRLTRPDQVLRARRRFAGILAAESPDLVLITAPWTHALFAPVARREGLPVVLWLHDALSGTPWLERLAGRHQPDLLIANSAFCLDAARMVFPSVPARLIYSPLTHASPSIDRDAMRRSLGVPSASVVIINVARMEPGKGQSVLIDALATLDHDPRWTCCLVGGAQRPEEESYLAELMRRVRANGLEERVRFLGQRSDVPDLLAAADVCCHPHLGGETFGLALIEALRAGLPVVASDLGGAREILADGSGVLVPPNDAAALASALARTLTQAGAKSGADARRARAHQLCDPTMRFEEFSETLASVRSLVSHV